MSLHATNTSIKEVSRTIAEVSRVRGVTTGLWRKVDPDSEVATISAAGQDNAEAAANDWGRIARVGMLTRAILMGRHDGKEPNPAQASPNTWMKTVRASGPSYSTKYAR